MQADKTRKQIKEGARRKIYWNVSSGLECAMGVAMECLIEYTRLGLPLSTKAIKGTIPGTNVLGEFYFREGACIIRLSLPLLEITKSVPKPYFHVLPPPMMDTWGHPTKFLNTAAFQSTSGKPGCWAPIEIVNRTDFEGWPVPAKFSIEPNEGSRGWSIIEGKEQPDGSYKVDGRSAVLKLAPDAMGSCKLLVDDGLVQLEKTFRIEAKCE